MEGNREFHVGVMVMENYTVLSQATFSPTHIRDTEVERFPTLVCYFQGSEGKG